MDLIGALLGGGRLPGGGGMEGGGFGGLAGGFGGAVFEDSYRCYSMAMADRAELEGGDKIILPSSALMTLTQLEVQYPMLFKLTNEAVPNNASNRSTHVGVIEFAAPERKCYVPGWIMKTLGLTEGCFVSVTNLRLPKAKFVKFRPHTTDFTTLANPKAFLEVALKKFSCLTKGHPICVFHPALQKNFYIDVLELKPADACSIIETDIDVDFAPPADSEAVAAAKAAKAMNGGPGSAKGTPKLGGNAGGGVIAIDDELLENGLFMGAGGGSSKGGNSSSSSSSSSTSSSSGPQALGSGESSAKRGKNELLAAAATNRLAASTTGGGDGESGSRTPSKFSPRVIPFAGEGRKLTDGSGGNMNGSSSSSTTTTTASSSSSPYSSSASLAALRGSPLLSPSSSSSSSPGGAGLGNSGNGITVLPGGGLVLGGGGAGGRPGSAGGLGVGRPRTLNRFEEARLKQREAAAFGGEGKSLK